MPIFPIPDDHRPRLVRVTDKENGRDLTTTFEFSLPPHLANLHRVEPNVRLSVTTYGNSDDPDDENSAPMLGGCLSLSYKPQGRRASFASGSSLFCSQATWPAHSAKALAYPGRSMLNMLAEQRDKR